ncbi:16S rRNA (uracil(1498)-N(3))-methyltransferase [Arachidicoccus ginsenosidimutans]|uniref:16S rRNA (uracil(1498)-N(3))-methyltransferase n=1 Tax=Arachidicoccus sp. BS20 TaxID=1850526 RepID=UPI0007F075B6|nr:16S rRNA (uracil(1498)-N(3))-methyltransferase [Arachidicoccus sp. BS20]ANI88795.1 16S rRNA (uracil(1498)-N(3))-methyltransferase [Arachidicoccus sp. BS20]
MQLPYFYEPNIDTAIRQFSLSETSAKHAVQVLRMKTGERLQLTDGNGLLATATIISSGKKNCVVQIDATENFPYMNKNICLAVSPTKNNARLEWLLEKVTEIGMRKIILLNCERTEKTNVKYERLHNILVSAMQQSRQVYLPELIAPTAFEQVVQENIYEEKYMAHCVDNEQKTGLKTTDSAKSKIILIGPEGDFTKEEIQLALDNKFQPVSLGNTRLRTETAGIVAATLLTM